MVSSSLNTKSFGYTNPSFLGEITNPLELIPQQRQQMLPITPKMIPHREIINESRHIEQGMDPTLIREFKEIIAQNWQLFKSFNSRLGFPISDFNQETPPFYFNKTKNSHTGLFTGHDKTGASVVKCFVIHPNLVLGIVYKKERDGRLRKTTQYEQRGLLHEFFHFLDYDGGRRENDMIKIGFINGYYDLDKEGSSAVFDEAVKEFLSIINASTILAYFDGYADKEKFLNLFSNNLSSVDWGIMYDFISKDTIYNIFEKEKSFKNISTAKLILLDYFRTLNQEQKIKFVQAIIKDARTGTMNNLLNWFGLKEGQENQIIDLSVIKQYLRKSPPSNYYDATWQKKNPGLSDPLADVYQGVFRTPFLY